MSDRSVVLRPAADLQVVVLRAHGRTDALGGGGGGGEEGGESMAGKSTHLDTPVEFSSDQGTKDQVGTENQKAC